MSVRIQYELQGVVFEWDSDKADTKVQKHGVSFLFVVHVIRHEETIRIISAREATREERRQYENP